MTNANICTCTLDGMTLSLDLVTLEMRADGAPVSVFGTMRKRVRFAGRLMNWARFAALCCAGGDARRWDGYHCHHVNYLCKGGADSIDNLFFLTVAQHKAIHAAGI